IATFKITTIMSKFASFENVNNRFHKKRKLDSANIVIEDKSDICSDIDKLLLSKEFSDVTIEVENERFKAHRVILAARSEYFRCLCYNGMRESKENVIVMKDISKSIFRILLKYIYTGVIIADEMKSCIFELIYFSDCYCFPKLHKKLIQFLSENLDSELALKAYEIAKLYEIKELMNASLNYIENNPYETLYHPSFVESSFDCVRDILKSDTLYISELKIYEILEHYLRKNGYADSKAKSIVKEIVRFPLISDNNIMDRLHIDGMFNMKECLELLKIKESTQSTKINYRYLLQKDTNYVISCQSCNLIKGQPEIKFAFASTKFHGSEFIDESKEDSVIEFTLGKRCKMKDKFSAHDISDDENKYLLFTLSQDCYVDTIIVHLWDKDQRLYDFDVSCGVNENDLKIIERVKMQRGQQIIKFNPMRIRFIKLKGTEVYNVRTYEFRVKNLAVYKQNN
ncbi:BTB/POZ domain-containing protein 9-like protein, partial [Dinothrombium tinctorium]